MYACGTDCIVGAGIARTRATNGRPYEEKRIPRVARNDKPCHSEQSIDRCGVEESVIPLIRQPFGLPPSPRGKVFRGTDSSRSFGMTIIFNFQFSIIFGACRKSTPQKSAIAVDIVFQPVFLWGHTGIFFELSQEGVTAGDAHHCPHLSDFYRGVFQKNFCLLHPVELDAFA